MFYAVVFEGMPTVYLNASDDAGVIRQAEHLAHYVDKPLRLVFVSAHNDPVAGPTQMRMVWSAPVTNDDETESDNGMWEKYRGGTSDMPYLD